MTTVTCDVMENLQLGALFAILVHPAPAFADQPRNGACRDNRDEYGFALVGHDYKTVHADNFGRCFFECSLQEKCQSVTYYWNNKECKMNNETKISRPEDFEKNSVATYKENTFRGVVIAPFRGLKRIRTFK